MFSFRPTPIQNKTFAQVLDEGQSNTYTHSGGGSNRAWEDIVAKGNLDEVTAVLAADGFRRGQFVGSGDNAIIALVNDGQCLRFRGKQTESPNTWEAPDIDEMIGEFYRREVAGCRIIGVNYVTSLDKAIKTEQITKADALILLEHLRIAIARNGSGYMLVDWERGDMIKFEQVGLLPDNTPVVLDMGSVMPVAHLDEIFKPSYAQKHQQEYRVLQTQPIPPLPEHIQWDGTWRTKDGIRKTEWYFPQVKTKQVIGVVTAQELERFRQQRGITHHGNTVFEKSIVADGLSMSEFKKLVQHAGRSFQPYGLNHFKRKILPRTQKGLCHLIDKERATYVKKREALLQREAL